MPVLPCDPVSASTVTSSRSSTWRASRPSATTGSATTTVGAEVGRLPSTACAPSAYVVPVDAFAHDRHEEATGHRRSGCRRTPARRPPAPASPGDGAADHGRRCRPASSGSSGAAPAGPRGRPRGRRRDARLPGSPGRSRDPCRPPARRRPALARPTASKIAARRSPISITSAEPRSAPARMAARIVAGSSVRGLSSVITSTSASRAAISPIIGRLPGSRSPPAPITTITWPSVSGRSVWIAASTASGLWA